ncbi:hypothetical protein A3I27_04445 [Candidatus Giovannonibacteria bacterium RIFCSPLOWO2_02_FULL_43_11b]|uniref:TrbL/VirB6 plasmid conjugal transfer protein n=1 Tax=Candidatus Giovannonibacteria bacterium RIFCSPHIGHO2_12_FULL_43_15 TaxID=1798341 RepID=A0A1F5WPI7_9BACT|nr:MAG: hypothetical protein A2739_00805 [Candidatus Giovannonibacteria bacterium RIFCSPHIGHO2_01_FULL_43_100]OGF66738.1 MAG: hypothetical protein A3B97_02385 [Candidatus Giovannonibacteria bacterium RIFCSPHIGHO2_02_FULL_43_32]OGF77514.1 MAG: hypothetical protein A3F23_00880 [Candidatus Giovannonibacteria bacterium RIFCSPHIGHO2_12_FULL_43_15]OGF78885.1 MAG: hypothetical protein A3A15_00280 [Candidatus Giovannonibacteria bacterium RIFCSPLOWO2_01_FULL_43_60]OGF89958.1 MAG: hypothetical protein A3
MEAIFSKKFLAGLLIISILSLTLPFHQAHAVSLKDLFTGGAKVVKAAPSVLKGAGKVALGFVITAAALKLLSGVIILIAGMLFDMSVGFTLDNDNYSSSKIDAIDAGWTFSRDIVNIFFIFILLFIAIATILGIESYGAKSLLARLIVVALLVNFSLLATRGIIFVSNSLAVQIYNSQSNIGDSDGEAGTIGTLFNFKFKKNLGARVLGMFKVQRIFAKVPIPDSGSTIANEIFGFGTIELGGIVITILGAFLLFAASFLFITRMAILWLLMILAPFGFVFLILPATRSYAQQWWKKLIDQAVFAPAFLFLFFISLKILEKLPDFTSKANDIKGTNEFLALILLQVSIAFILLFASLMVAKQLGIYGADGAMSMAKKSGKAFGRYAGKTLPSRGVSRTAKAIENTRVGNAMKQIPGVGRMLGAASQLNAKEIKEYEKKYQGYDRKILENMANNPRANLMNSSQRAAVNNLLGKARGADEKAKRDKEERAQEDMILKSPLFSAEEKLATMVRRERRRSSEAESRATEAESKAEEAEEKAEEAGTRAARAETSAGEARAEASATKPTQNETNAT